MPTRKKLYIVSRTYLVEKRTEVRASTAKEALEITSDYKYDDFETVADTTSTAEESAFVDYDSSIQRKLES